jgi:hypothetical protein
VGRGDGWAVLWRLDVLRWEVGHAGLGEGLDARRRSGFHLSGGGGELGRFGGFPRFCFCRQVTDTRNTFKGQLIGARNTSKEQ